MTIKIIPVKAYDFEFLKILVKNNYGNDISPATFDVDLNDYENPRCRNCNTLVRGAYANPGVRPHYCYNCGAEMIWPDDYPKSKSI